jgi:hypothetical protein
MEGKEDSLPQPAITTGSNKFILCRVAQGGVRAKLVSEVSARDLFSSVPCGAMHT